MALRTGYQRTSLTGDHPDRPSHLSRRALVTRSVSVLATIGLSAAVLWAVPTTRLVLQQSFTRMPTNYAELYFAADPSVSLGSEVTVPVTVDAHGSESGILHLRIWLTSRNGQTEATTTTVAARDGVPSTTTVTLFLQMPQSVVHVTLLGHMQTLLYRLHNAAPPRPPRLKAKGARK